MKKSIIWAILAMLLPVTQAWAWGGGHSKHTGTISVQSTGNGTVYVASSSTATSGSSSGSVDCGSQESGDNNTKDYWLFATADAGYHFKGWSESSGGSIVSEDNPLKYTIKVNNNATRYASFEKNPAVSVSFETPVNGSYTITVGGETKPDYSALETSDEMTLTATPANGYRVYGWYTVSGGNRTYFAYGATTKYVAMSATTIGVDFISESEVAKVATYDELVAALKGSSKVAEIAAGTKILVPSGTMLTIPAGKKVTTCSKQVANSDGTTSTSYGYLAVAGTLKVEGVVDGTGKVLKVVKDVTQSAPITPKTAAGEITSFQFSNYGKFKCTYCKTTVTSVTPTVTGTPSCTVSWGVTLNGATPYAISAQDPYALNVSFPVDESAHSTIGVPNQIQSINGCQTSDNTTAASGHFLLLKDWKINNQVYQGVVDCAGKKLTFGNSDDYHKRVMCFNGQFDHNSGTFKNGCVACINCSYAQIVSCKNEPKFYFFDMGTAESPATVKITYYSGSNAASGSLKYAYFYSGYINYTFTANNDKDVAFSYVYGGSFNNDPTDKSIIEPGYEIDSSSGRYVLVKAVAKPDVVNIGEQAYKSLQEAVDAAASGARLELIQALELDGEVKIASGKQLTIDLAGYDLSGGSIVNEGKLRFEDTNASTAKRTMSTPVTNNGSGTIDITFGDYSGTFTLNGGTLTTHNGTFASTFSVVENGGTWTMKGGKYSCPITIPEGYRVYDNGYCGEIVKGLINPNNPISSSSADFSYTIKALEDADSLALYTKYMHGTTARDKYGDADWDRIAELHSCVGYLADTKYIEAAVVFDRPVKKNTFYGVVKMSSSTKSMAFGDLAAGEECRMLIPMILANNYTPKGYDYMFDGHEDGVWETLYCGGRNTSLDNIGTTVTLFFQVRTQTRSADYTTENQHHDYLPYMDLAVYSKKLTGNGAIYGETDYTSLSGALSAAKYNGTVRLSKDCSEAIVVNQATTFTIDTNNFVFTGSVAAGTGYVLTTSDLGDGKTQYAVAKKSYALTVPAVAHATIESVKVGDTTLQAGNDGKYAVNHGDTVTVTYKADAGYTLANTMATLENVTGDAEVDASDVSATIEVYAITYVLYGKDGDATNNAANPTSYTVVSNDISLLEPTKVGHEFCGWFADAEFTGGVGDVAIPAGSTGAKTFYAKWERCLVSFKPIGGIVLESVMTNGVAVAPGDDGFYAVYYGDEVVISNKASRGYSIYRDEEVVEVDEIIVVLKDAKAIGWPEVRANGYTITYNLGTGVANNENNQEEYTYPSSIKLYAPTRAGHTFLGWYYDEDLTRKVQGTFVDDDGTTGTFIPGGAAENLTLYAKWEKAPVVLTVAIPANAHVKVVSVLANGVAIDSVGGAYAIPQTEPQTVVITYAADAGYGLTVDQTTATIENIQANTEVTAPVADLIKYSITYEGVESDDGYQKEYYVTSEDITLPTLDDKGDYEFGGWYEDAAFTKKTGKVTLPSGSTGDKTFYACWLKDMTQVAAKNTDLANTNFVVKVPDSVSADDLQKTADNGLKTWQNFALDAAGVTEESTTITVETNATANVSEVTVKIETTEAVKKVAVVQVVSANDATVSNVVTELAAVENNKAEVAVNYAEKDAGVYRAAVVVEDANHVETLIPDVTAAAVEVVKKTDEAKATVVTVPFANDVSGNPLTIATLIDSSSLSEGDTIKKYNKTTGLYDVWYVEDGALTPMQTTNGGQPSTPAPAGDTTVEAGQSLIVERASADTTDKPITMVGQYTDNVVTPIEQPTVSSQEPEPDPVWNLVSNIDTQKKFDLNAIETANADDMVVVQPDNPNLPQKRYRRTKLGQWAYTTNSITEVDFFGQKVKVATPVEVTDDSEIKGGGWFWYVSGGGDKDTKIDWKKK